MSVHCKISLPDKATVKDVARIISFCLGYPKRKLYLDSMHWGAEPVGGAKVEANSIPSLATIVWKDKKGENLIKEKGFVLYHFEWGAFNQGTLGRGMLPPSTAFWLAIGNRLINFFGGTLTYNDCSDEEINESVGTIVRYTPDDGMEWQDFQQKLYDVEPLTIDEITSYKDKAAYGLGPNLAFAENS